jgi:hypothetical protein
MPETIAIQTSVRGGVLRDTPKVKTHTAHSAPSLRERQNGHARTGANRAGTRTGTAPEAGIAVFKIAFERWINETSQPDLPRLIRESLGELKAVTADK